MTIHATQPLPIAETTGRIPASRSHSLLEPAVLTLPEGATFIAYPGGRNARLAVDDLVANDLLHGRRFLGFADDNHTAHRDDCVSLRDAVAKWNPDAVVLCTRRPDVERRLAEKVRTEYAHILVVSGRDVLVDALKPLPGDKRRPRRMSDIRKLTIVMCKTCNIRCAFCYQTDFTERMDPAIFNERLTPIYPHVDTISLVGGEVTAYRHALPFAQRVARDYPNAALDLTTNAVLMGETWSDVLCTTGGGVYVSVVAATPETYHRVTGADKLDQVIENVTRLVGMRNKCNADLTIKMSMVVTPDTQHEIADMVRLAESLGVDGTYIGVDFLGMNQLDKPFIENQVRQVLDETTIPTVWDRVGMLFPELPDSSEISSPCTLDRSSLYVEVNGDAFVCCHSHLSIGSLREADIETLWTSPAAYALEKDVSGGQCATCPQDCVYRPATLSAD